jgi:hypothetical protein
LNARLQAVLANNLLPTKKGDMELVKNAARNLGIRPN